MVICVWNIAVFFPDTFLMLYPVVFLRYFVVCIISSVMDFQCHKGQPVSDISLQIPGDHNVLNSLAVSDG